jgi:hypothetical protein
VFMCYVLVLLITIKYNVVLIASAIENVQRLLMNTCLPRTGQRFSW